MLIQLTPEQVNESWELLRPMVEQSLPPGARSSTNAMTNILTSALVRDCRFWGYYKRDEEDPQDLKPSRFAALVVTAINQEPVTRLNRMLIFSFWGDSSLTRGDVVTGLQTLEEFAEDKDCTVMYSFSQNRQLEQVLGSMGWNSEHSLIYKAI